MIKSKYFLFVILGIILLIILWLLHEYNPILAGSPGWSESIEESKDRGVFIRELFLKKKSIFITDSIKIVVRNAWVEHMWQFQNWIDKSTKHKSMKQILIAVDPQYMSKYNIRWGIYHNKDIAYGYGNYIGYYKGILMLKYINNKNPLSNLEFPIYSLDYTKRFPDEYPLDKIGSLKLYKNKLK